MGYLYCHKIAAAAVGLGLGVTISGGAMWPHPEAVFAQSITVSSSSPQQQQSTTTSTSTTTTITSSSSVIVNGLISGAASRVTKEIILHPLDTIRARIQGRRSVRKGEIDDKLDAAAPPPATTTSLLSNVYDGLVPALIGGIPAGAIFFAVKDYSKEILVTSFNMHKFEATVASVVLANVPYWILRTPAEVAKTKEQLYGSSEGSGGIATTKANSTPGFIKSTLGFIKSIPASYDSYGSNFIYAVPADVVKFAVYEYLKTMFGYSGKIEGPPAAALGSLSGALSQLVVAPLDVVRTRKMLGSTRGVLDTAKDIVSEEGLFFLVSAAWVPRISRALLSGAIQLSTYEISQNFLNSK